MCIEIKQGRQSGRHLYFAYQFNMRNLYLEKKNLLLILFLKTEAGYFLEIFLNFWLI